jgi:hypothetical protein
MFVFGNILDGQDKNNKNKENQCHHGLSSKRINNINPPSLGGGVVSFTNALIETQVLLTSWSCRTKYNYVWNGMVVLGNKKKKKTNKKPGEEKKRKKKSSSSHPPQKTKGFFPNRTIITNNK